MRPSRRLSRYVPGSPVRRVALPLACAALAFTVGCEGPPVARGASAALDARGEARRRVERAGVVATYDDETGKLARLELDANKDGRVDIWSYRNGTRTERIEIDRDGDGKVDRWEYYDEAGALARVGLAHGAAGTPDRWAYPDGSGQLSRLEISTRGDGVIDRVEHYEQGQLRRAEADENGDGRTDAWETFDAPREPGGPPVLRTLELDTEGRGRPSQRLHYRPDGSLERLETDADGSGAFTPVATP